LQKELSLQSGKPRDWSWPSREYKVANVKKRRRVDEDVVWSWWMVRVSLLFYDGWG
jgi:hypothetical protein